MTLSTGIVPPNDRVSNLPPFGFNNADHASLWDSFRSQLPFLTIFDPKSVARMISSLIDTQRHLGWLPDCRMSLCKGPSSTTLVSMHA